MNSSFVHPLSFTPCNYSSDFEKGAHSRGHGYGIFVKDLIDLRYESTNFYRNKMISTLRESTYAGSLQEMIRLKTQRLLLIRLTTST